MSILISYYFKINPFITIEMIITKAFSIHSFKQIIIKMINAICIKPVMYI